MAQKSFRRRLLRSFVLSAQSAAAAAAALPKGISKLSPRRRRRRLRCRRRHVLCIFTQKYGAAAAAPDGFESH